MVQGATKSAAPDPLVITMPYTRMAIPLRFIATGEGCVNCLKNNMRLIDTFEKHRKESNISLEEYIKGSRLRLGDDLKNSKKIYLDTNYWLELRNVELGRAKNDDFTSLLSLLKNEVKSGKVICPISDENFYEILLQSDPTTLRASIDLVDELSKGVALLSSEERIQYEILFFIRSATLGKEAVYHPNECIWSKVAFIYGTLIPKQPNLLPEEQLVMQKAFFDQMWSMSTT
jgi:hypothetical protein